MGAPDEARWADQRLLALLLQSLIVAGPFVAAALAGRAVISATASTPVVLRLGLVLLVSCAVGYVLERAARRLLPIPALLRMTLLFPDRAPSRLKVARTAISRQRLGERLERAADATTSAGDAADTMVALIASLARHDRKTRGHCERVRVFAEMLAGELHLAPGDRDRLVWAALLHDIGKLEVASSLLNKPGRPTDEEWAELRRHPEAGARLCAGLMDWLGEWGDGIAQHHEKYDGTGYPLGLAGQEISRSARMISVVDVFEVLTATRSYQSPVSTRKARQELARCAGTQFDPAMVRAFLAISLPRLLWATGPLSLLAHLPWLRELQTVGAQATAAAGSTALNTAGITAVVVGTVVSTPGSLGVAQAAHQDPTHAPAVPGSRGQVPPSHPQTSPARQQATRVPPGPAATGPAAAATSSAPLPPAGSGTPRAVPAPRPPVTASPSTAASPRSAGTPAGHTRAPSAAGAGSASPTPPPHASTTPVAAPEPAAPSGPAPTPGAEQSAAAARPPAAGPAPARPVPPAPVPPAPSRTSTRPPAAHGRKHNGAKPPAARPHATRAVPPTTSPSPAAAPAPRSTGPAPAAPPPAVTPPAAPAGPAAGPGRQDDPKGDDKGKDKDKDKDKDKGSGSGSGSGKDTGSGEGTGSGKQGPQG